MGEKPNWVVNGATDYHLLLEAKDTDLPHWAGRVRSSDGAAASIRDRARAISFASRFSLDPSSALLFQFGSLVHSALPFPKSALPSLRI
jgi:hypothetical protein